MGACSRCRCRTRRPLVSKRSMKFSSRLARTLPLLWTLIPAIETYFKVLWKIWRLFRREAVGEIEGFGYILYISSIRYCCWITYYASSLSSHAAIKAEFEIWESCRELAPTQIYPMLSLKWLSECVVSSSRWWCGTGLVVIGVWISTDNNCIPWSSFAAVTQN